MKKFFNFRPFFIAFVSMLVGGLCLPTFYFLPAHAKGILFILFLTPLAICSVLQFRKYFKYVVCIVVPLILVFCIGGIRGTINDNLIGDTYNAKIVAVTTDKYNSEYNSIEARNVIINGKKINRKITLYVEGEDVSKFEPGTVLTFKGNFKKQKDFVRLNTNNFGYINVNIENATISQTKMTVAESIRNYVKGNLSKIKDKELSGLCYAVLFGNKSDLAVSTQTNFSLSGTAHLLAVSGLHVGFLISVVMFILKMCKAGRKTKLIVTSSFLLLLMFLCAFSPSVVRASVVAIVYLIADFFGKEKDQLSTLSFAGILILLINPLTSVLYSFLLSFACVFSILCLASSITKLLQKIKIWKWLAQSIAVIICVNLATIPLVALMNQELNLMAFVSNIFLIPLFSLFYSVMFVLVLVTTVFPFASIILNAVIAPYFLFNIVQNLFTLVPPLIVNSNITLAVTVMLLIFILSRYVFLKPKARTMLSAFLCLLIVANFTIINLTFIPKQNLINFEKGEITVITNNSSDTIAVVDKLSDKTPTLLKKRIKALQIKNISAVLYNGEYNVNLIKNYLDNCDIPLVIKETYDESVTELFKYNNLYIAGLGASESVKIGNVIIYSFITKQIEAFVFETENKKIVFTDYIKSNKAAGLIEELNPDVVNARFISTYVTDNFNLGTVVSFSNVEVSDCFNMLFSVPLKIKY